MSRISEAKSQVPLPDVQKLEERLTSEFKRAEPAAVGFMNTEHLASLVTVVRQPPSLQFQGTSQLHAPIHDQLMAESVAPLTHMSTGQLAYAVAELVVRREAEISQSKKNSAKKGLEVLGNLARMFEHLSLLQHKSGK